MAVLYEFYTDKEIIKIWQQDICFDSYEAIMMDIEIKEKIRE